MTTPDQLFLAFQEALAGRYSIDRELGRGGMGVVYLAREVHLDRPVAIKLLPPERAADRTLRERFLREARLAAKLSHPNIIPIFSVEETDGFVFFVMAYIDGETLADRVRTRGPLSAAEGARVLREAAWALSYAHDQGLIHRDVKPDNILMEAASGRVLVADFGIAAAAKDAAADGISGTPEFMSPEQALGTTLDARSDLYGLGATAFYAFSGRFPFEGRNATEVLAKQVTAPAPSLASLGLTVPRRLAALIDRCLSKSVEQRPESARALAEQLGDAIERKRELPIALRSFVRTTARLDGAGTLIATGGLAAGLLLSWVSFYAGLGTASAIIMTCVMVAGILGPFAALVDSARRLLKQGFSYRDVDPAFQAVLEQAREELALEKPLRNVIAERVLGKLAIGSGGFVFLSVAMFRFAGVAFNKWVADSLGVAGSTLFSIVLFFAGIVGVFAGMGYLALKQRRTEPETEFWAKLWRGWFGRLAFRVAGRFVKGRVDTAYTHRPTELSLGMAAEQLFDSLGRDTRRALGDLPSVLKRLQDDAQELRKRHEAVAEAIADAGDNAVGSEFTEIRELRDALQEKLALTVGTLETMRLDLLKLHAGSVPVESVTTHLGMAAEVSREVQRLISAHGELDRVMRFPRTPETTPV